VAVNFYKVYFKIQQWQGVEWKHQNSISLPTPLFAMTCCSSNVTVFKLEPDNADLEVWKGFGRDTYGNATFRDGKFILTYFRIAEYASDIAEIVLNLNINQIIAYNNIHKNKISVVSFNRVKINGYL